MPGQTGQERHDRRGLNQAAAEGIGDSDVAGDDGIHQAWHAQQRIAE